MRPVNFLYSQDPGAHLKSNLRCDVHNVPTFQAVSPARHTDDAKLEVVDQIDDQTSVLMQERL